MTDIIRNEQTQRFELTVDGHLAYVTYEAVPGGVVYAHTIVPEAISGRGIAGRLVKHALDYAAAHQQKVTPSCAYVRAYIGKHPEYQSLVA